MDLDLIRSELAAAGWNDLEPGNAGGVAFDLVGARRFNIMAWNIYVKVLSVLDQAAVAMWQANFDELNKGSKAMLRGRHFVLCLLADDVSPAMAQSFSSDRFGLGGALRGQVGGGLILVGDGASGQVYGKIPSIPVDVAQFGNATSEALRRALAAQPSGVFAETEPADTEADEAVAEETCPTCGQAVRAGARFCDGCGAAMTITCVECGASLRAGAKFCDDCGAAVAPQA